MSTASHPKAYKAYAFLEKGGDLHPIDVEWKDPQVGEIVIKVLACGVCARYVHGLLSVLHGLSFHYDLGQ